MDFTQLAVTRRTLLGAAGLAPLAAAAQSTQVFETRLAPVPLTVDMQATIAGSGSVTATLNGRRLTIDGKFQGLRSPATVARLHLAPPARRGDAFADLKVSIGTVTDSKGRCVFADLPADEGQGGDKELHVDALIARANALLGLVIIVVAVRLAR